MAPPDVGNLISVEELRAWLAGGEPVTVLDIRTDHDRSEWWIPGSVHVDAYAALKNGEQGPLSSVDLPTTTPVVTICGVGGTAALATKHLRERGINALTLAGGMKAWSLAWNTAEVTNAGLPARVLQVRRTGKGCLSYLVGSAGEAIVIDPSIDPGIYVQLSAERGWRITQVIETHIHADHVSRARELARLTEATLRLPAQALVRFDYMPVREGDFLSVGSTKLTAWHTPGHTSESTCYLIDRAVFTGDTLFTSSFGRPDLGVDKSNAQRRATELYRSLKRLLSLPRDSLVLPGHSSQPIAFDRVPVSGVLSAVHRRLAARLRTEAAFVPSVIEGLPDPPPNHVRIAGFNQAGAFPDGDVTDLEAGANRCAIP